MARRKLSRNPANVIRRQKYRQARKQGASPGDARTGRSFGRKRFELYVATRFPNDRPPRRRPERRPSESRPEPHDERDRGTKDQRLALFRRWSKHPGKGLLRSQFPKRFQDMIFKWNDKAGKDAFSSFGYKKFYYWFVEHMDEIEAEREAEAHDT